MSAMHWTLGAIAQALPQAVLHGDANPTIVRVVTDSRDVRAGDLFVALKGERFDAHDFVVQVAAAGAAAVIVEALQPKLSIPQLVVPSTRAALGHLARAWRGAHPLPLAAVTGSNGKTTVKEMIASIFAAAVGETARLSTAGNFNNDIGLPLTLLRLRAEHKLAVIELGMNHPGETAELAAIASPNVALINNAQREHQEFMVSVAAVAAEHASVIAALPADGVAVFPADSEFSAQWRTVAGARRIIDFGIGAGAVQGTAVAVGTGQQLAVTTPAGNFNVLLALPGVHNLRNALAATAVALGAGVGLDAIAAGLASFAAVAGRLQVHQAERLTVIDDSYNANPDSVRAAIDVLAAAAAPTLLVLGDMGEVGDQGPEFHREVGAYARQRGIRRLYAAGELSRAAVAAYAAPADQAAARHFDSVDALVEQLRVEAAALRAAGGTVLIKGSRFMRMERALAPLCGTQSQGSH